MQAPADRPAARAAGRLRRRFRGERRPPSSGAPDGAPAPQPDSYTWPGNTTLQVRSVNGLLANDTPKAPILAADATSRLGGEVAVNLATGAFDYRPPTGAQNLTDRFSYTVAGAAPTEVTIALQERIWYVDNRATPGGDGSEGAPFRQLADAAAASDAADTLFVFPGDGTSSGQDAGIVLQAGQRLLGAAAGLIFSNQILIPPAGMPHLSNSALGPAAGTTPVIRLATDNEVSGLVIEAAHNEAILAVGGGGHRLHDNLLGSDPAGSGDGIRLLRVDGAVAIGGNRISGTGRDGIHCSNREAEDGSSLPPARVTSRLVITGNTLGGTGRHGIGIELAGAGNQAEVQVLTNVLADPAGAGLALSSRGGAELQAVISRNTVTGSGVAAIDLTAADSSALDAFVANNALGQSLATRDFSSTLQAGGAPTGCLELLGNRNAGGDSRFAVSNNGGSQALAEADNDTAVNRSGPISDLAAGACALPLSGSLLFEVNCGGCHTANGLGSGFLGGNISGMGSDRINAQLTANQLMLDIRLTRLEIEVVAAFLAPPP